MHRRGIRFHTGGISQCSSQGLRREETAVRCEVVMPGVITCAGYVAGTRVQRLDLAAKACRVTRVEQRQVGTDAGQV